MYGQVKRPKGKVEMGWNEAPLLDFVEQPGSPGGIFNVDTREEYVDGGDDGHQHKDNFPRTVHQSK